jgi:hypothetical protein
MITLVLRARISAKSEIRNLIGEFKRLAGRCELILSARIIPTAFNGDTAN